MSALWSFAMLVEAVRGRPFGPSPPEIHGVAIDSRTVAQGDAFFAIRGDRFDGHDFVGSALARGAATAIVAEERLPGLGRITGSLIVVRDVLEALARLGIAARARTAARVAAVTGSVGKTSTKDMLRVALAPSGPTHGAPASFNNHWGVPLTLARMPADAAFAVFEIGMNHPGEIAPLAVFVRPDAAIITTVDAVHLAAFPDVTAIAEAKAEIFGGVAEGGAAILNRDNRYFDFLARLAGEAGVGRVIAFGEHADADARLEDLVLEPDCSTVSARILGRDITYFLAAPGRHIVQNSLAVLAAVAELGGDLDRAAAALAGWAPPKGRGERHLLSFGTGAALLIDESYNANPASMRAAIALLGQALPAEGGDRVAVLGDMLELGPEELQLHAALAEPLFAAGVRRVYAAGPRMQALWEVLPPERRGAWAATAADLEAILASEIAPGDVVMVKGSNGSRMGPLVEALRQRFSPPPRATAGLVRQGERSI